MPQEIYPAIALEQLIKGQKVWVRLPNGKSRQLIAAVDSSDRNVFIVDNKVFASVGQLRLERTTKLFKSRTSFDEEINYPYFSLFIDSVQGQLILLGTYNNTQKVLGNISFEDVERINFQFLGNGQFIGSALSLDKDRFIVFNSTNVVPIEPEILVLNSLEAADPAELLYTGDVVIKPETPDEEYEARSLSPVFSRFDNNIRDLSTVYVIDPASGVVQRPYSGTNFSYAETRNTINTNASGFSTFNVNRTFEKPGGFIEVYVPGHIITQPHSSSADLSYTYNESRNHTWDYENNYPIKSTDNSDRLFVDKTSGTNYYFESEINTNNTVYAVTGTFPNFNINYSATGSIVTAQTIGEDYIIEKREPVIVNNSLTLANISIEDKDFEQTTNTSLTYENIRPSLDFTHNANSVSNFTSSNVRTLNTTNIISIINLGKIGIYRESTLQRNDNDNNNSNTEVIQEFFLVTTDLIGQPESSNPGVLDVESRLTTSGSDEIVSGTSSSLLTQNRTDDRNSFYKLAHHTNAPITLKPGFANTANVSIITKNTITNFLADPDNALNAIAVTFDPQEVQRDLNRIATRVRVVERVSLGAAVTGSTTYTRVALDPLDSRGLDLSNNDICMLKTTINSVLYLCRCKITNILTTETNNPSTSSQPDEVELNSLNLEIQSVEIITSFFTTSDFIFTVDGCDIFNFLNPNWTNLMEIDNSSSTQDDLYLSVAMPVPITDEDTQTLIFKIESDGISYLGITGGSISNIDTSTGAESWIKFYQFPFQF